jgi:uncharacterized protein
MDPKNLRIGFPLCSNFDLYRESDVEIRWLMDESDYVRYWAGGMSNNLDRASIYGCQGFESDYVGVVWGRDLILRRGIWALGDPNCSYDTTDKLVSGRIRTWAEEALTLLRNRYRIFLTRGILGTLIFCEDKPTQEFFTKLATPQ